MHQFLWKTSIFCSLVVVSLICSRSTRVGQAQTQAERPFSKWLRVEGDSVAIVVLVDVFMPDGSPAKNLIVSQWPKDQVAIDIASNQLTIVDPGTLGTTIRVKTRDQRFQATIPFLKHEVRDLAINGLKVKLVAIEFSDVAISVVDGDQPVPNAHVRALSDEEVVEGVTDTSGRVILKLPNGPVPSHVMAWTDNHRIGATKRQQPPALKAAAPSSISISIVPCRTHNIKIVDDNMQPVSGFKVMAFVTLPENERQVSLTDFGDLITDNNGIATTEWCPQWPGARIILRNDDPNRTRFPSGKGEFAFFQTHETLTESDITNIQVTHSKPRQLVRGNVKLPPNVPGGFLVKLLSFQGETENTSDLVYARVDADGDFVISVRPDCTYCAFLDDVRWISNTTDGIAFDSKTGTAHPPSLAVVEGTLVEIHVTQGKTGKPISNCGVWLQYNHMFEYERNGVEAAGMGGRG